MDSFLVGYLITFQPFLSNFGQFLQKPEEFIEYMEFLSFESSFFDCVFLM